MGHHDFDDEDDMAAIEGTAHRGRRRGNRDVEQEKTSESRGAAAKGKTTTSRREERIVRGRRGDHRGGHADGPYTDNLGFRHPGAREIGKQIAALTHDQQADLDELDAGITRLKGSEEEPITEEERMMLESHLHALSARVEIRENAIIRRLRTRELIEIASTSDSDTLARATHAKVLGLLKVEPVTIPMPTARKRIAESAGGL